MSIAELHHTSESGSGNAAALTRRDLLRALGIGGGAVLAGAGLAAAQDATPSTEVPPQTNVGTRTPGGPTVSDKVFELNADVDAIFAFVRDEVRYEAYAGALRGPLGTLWGLAGNSVDQAQLLAAMLNEAKVTTRFVTGTLDEAQADTLFQSMNLDLEIALRHAEKVHALPNAPDEESTPTAVTDEQQRLLDDLANRADAMIVEAAAQLEDGIDTIMTALADAGLTLPGRDIALPDRERTQHVWLQSAFGAEWLDLDPSFPDAERGSAHGTATSTFDELPDDFYHRVTFRLIGEKISGGQVAREELLSHTARSQDLVGAPLTLLHVPPDSLRAVGAAIEGGLEGTVQYIPHLAIGATDVVAGTGRVTLATGGGLTDLIGGSSQDGDTIGEWFEADIVSPDLPDRHVVREIFDRLGTELRSEMPPDVSQVPAAEITNYGEGSGDVFLPMVQMWSIVAMSGDVPMSYFAQDYSIDDMYSNLSLLPFGHALVRSGLSQRLAESGSPRLFMDRPNLTAFVLSAADLAADSASVEAAIDLLHQSVVPLQWKATEGAVSPSVAAGVLSHVAERQTTAESESDAASELTSGVSVGRLFEEARRLAIGLAVLKPGVPVADDVSMSARARLLVEQALAEGYVVIIPRSPIELGGGQHSGWWQVHLETGETRDVLENGRSQAGLEYAKTVQVSVQATPALRALAACKVANIFIAAGAAILVGIGAFIGGQASSGGITDAGAFIAVGVGSAGFGSTVAGTVILGIAC